MNFHESFLDRAQHKHRPLTMYKKSVLGPLDQLTDQMMRYGTQAEIAYSRACTVNDILSRLRRLLQNKVQTSNIQLL